MCKSGWFMVKIMCLLMFASQPSVASVVFFLESPSADTSTFSWSVIVSLVWRYVITLKLPVGDCTDTFDRRDICWPSVTMCNDAVWFCSFTSSCAAVHPCAKRHIYVLSMCLNVCLHVLWETLYKRPKVMWLIHWHFTCPLVLPKPVFYLNLETQKEVFSRMSKLILSAQRYFFCCFFAMNRLKINFQNIACNNLMQFSPLLANLIKLIIIK